ncbi:MAG: lipopolysaccharide biosynthesis protein, partial [Spirochaetaceae bacterium]|nr:lipopolysaccharide biosynthesis protein [Spirochaetaceae bacterium]
MEENKIQDDEISLIDLFAVLWKYKFLIISVTVIAMIAVLIFSIVSISLPPEKSYLPNKYTAQAQMLINNDSSSSGGLSSMLS